MDLVHRNHHARDCSCQGDTAGWKLHYQHSWLYRLTSSRWTQEADSIINTYTTWLTLNSAYDLRDESHDLLLGKVPRSFLSVERQYGTFRSIVDEIAVDQGVISFNSGMVLTSWSVGFLPDRDV